ncbi:MAG: hypothetical protein D6675_12600, partial [Gemmatimonadetes bacterium]
IRGVASPVQVGNMWLFFLTVYSNEVVGEMIHFQTYVYAFDAVVPVIETIEFEANQVIGSPTDPFEWHAVYVHLRLPDQFTIVAENDRVQEECFEVCVTDPYFTVEGFEILNTPVTVYFLEAGGVRMDVPDFIQVDYPSTFQECASVCFQLNAGDSRLPDDGVVTLSGNVEFRSENVDSAGVSAPLAVHVLPDVAGSTLILLGDLDDLELIDLWPVGDFSRDDCVDGFDLLTMLFAYNSEPGDVNWNPVCDVALTGYSNRLGHDGRIDFYDLLRFAVYYGQGDCGRAYFPPVPLDGADSE